MKRFTYPATLYKSDETFALVVDDLHLVASGSTVEEVFEGALDQLEIYLGIALKYDYEIPSAQTYLEAMVNKPKTTVLLVSTKK